MQPVDVNRPHRGPRGSVKSHAVKDALGRGQSAQRVGLKTSAMTGSIPSDGDLGGSGLGTHRAEDALAAAAEDRARHAGPDSRSR